jgi:hypothetical protein
VTILSVYTSLPTITHGCKLRGSLLRLIKAVCLLHIYCKAPLNITDIERAQYKFIYHLYSVVELAAKHPQGTRATPPSPKSPWIPEDGGMISYQERFIFLTVLKRYLTSVHDEWFLRTQGKVKMGCEHAEALD